MTPPPERREASAWFGRHPVLTVLGAVVVALVVLGAPFLLLLVA